MTTFQISSPAFSHKGNIPAKYTCSGENVSPAINWENAPTGTVSYTLIMDDPDAPLGTWVHWIYFNIPANVTGLEEDIYHLGKVENGTVTGVNSGGKKEYSGPCPPTGQHRYFFKLYALDTSLEISGSATKAELIKAMQGHILAQTELMGLYKK